MKVISKLLMALWMVVALPTAAQDTLYRCGNEYTNDPIQAEKKGCKLLAENLPTPENSAFNHPAIIESEDQIFSGPEYRNLRIILLLLLPVVVLLGGRMILVSRSRARQSAPDDAMYGMVAKEMEAGQIDKGLWTRLFANNDGDAQKTRAAYIRERVFELWEAQQSTQSHEAIHKGE
jgi:hypothetical protein